MVRFEVLDANRLVNIETGKVTALGAGGHLLAYLMLHSPAGVDRRRCVLDLYPEDEYEVSGNRLRVAVARFRKQLGDVLVAEGTELRLDTREIEVDYQEVLSQLKEVSDLVDVQDELQALTELLPKLRLKLLPEVSDFWVRVWQQEWQAASTKWLSRLAILARDAGNWKLTGQALNAVLDHDISNVEAWRSYLKALHETGEIDRGIRELNVVGKSGEQELSSVDVAGLQSYANELKSGEHDVTNRWSDSQLLSLGRLLARAIEDAPGDAADFFMSHGAVGEFYRDPSTFLPFLYEIIADNKKLAIDKEQDIRLKIMDAAGLKYDWREVIRQTDHLLSQELDIVRRGRVLFGRSFAHFQARDFESALAAVLESVAIYSSMDDFPKTMNSRALEASFRWHLGEYEKALLMYKEVREVLAKQDSPLARANNAINWANSATVYAILGDWTQGAYAVDSCFAAMGAEPNENMLAMVNTVSGLIWVRNGEVEKGVDLIADGLKRGFRRGSAREQQIGLEWAAGALSYLGWHSESLGVLDWVNEWRINTEHSRSVAEAKYAEMIIEECDHAKAVRLDPEEDPKKVISYTISLLRKSEPRRGVA